MEIGGINSNVAAVVAAQTGDGKTVTASAAETKPTNDAAVALELPGGDEIALAQVSEARLAEALRAAGIKPTAESMKMLELLLANGFPGDRENLQKLNQAVRLMEGDLGKAMFFLKAEMRPNIANAEALLGYISKNTSLGSQLQALADALSELPPSLRDSALRLVFPESASALTGESITGGSAARGDVAEAEGQIFAKVTDGAAKPILEGLRAAPLEADARLKTALSEAASVFERDGGAAAAKETAKAGGEAALTGMIGKLPSNVKEALLAEMTRVVSEMGEAAGKPEFSDKNAAKLFKAAQNAILEVFPETAGKTLTNADKSELLKSVLNLAARGEIDAKPKISKGELEKAVFEKFFIKPDSLEKREFGERMTELGETLRKLTNFAKDEGLTGTPFEKAVTDTAKNLDFLGRIKDSQFIQIPISIGDQPVNAELYVFKREHKIKGQGGQARTALLALDLANLGHFEAYLSKTGADVYCQFGLESEEAETLVRREISRLAELFSEHSLRLAGCGYKKTEEPFNLGMDEPNRRDERVFEDYEYNFRV